MRISISWILSERERSLSVGARVPSNDFRSSNGYFRSITKLKNGSVPTLGETEKNGKQKIPAPHP